MTDYANCQAKVADTEHDRRLARHDELLDDLVVAEAERRGAKKMLWCVLGFVGLSGVLSIIQLALGLT